MGFGVSAKALPAAGTAIQGVHTSPLATYRHKTILQANVSLGDSPILLSGSLRNGVFPGVYGDRKAIAANRQPARGYGKRSQDRTSLLGPADAGTTRLSFRNPTFLLIVLK